MEVSTPLPRNFFVGSLEGKEVPQWKQPHVCKSTKVYSVCTGHVRSALWVVRIMALSDSHVKTDTWSVEQTKSCDTVRVFPSRFKH